MTRQRAQGSGLRAQGAGPTGVARAQASGRRAQGAGPTGVARVQGSGLRAQGAGPIGVARAQGSGLGGRGAGPTGVARAFRPAVAALWLVGALVLWNTVFDAHIVKGARDYVDRQQLFIAGRGPQQDMERSMAEARSAGLRSASLWTVAELLPGAALWLTVHRRTNRRLPR
jgi:hypothetical protein